LTLTAFNISNTVKHKHHVKHHPGCSTSTCDARINKVWAENHRPKEVNNITTLDLCVANRENGEPGSTSYDTINWFAVNEYYGAYSFLHSTWAAAGGEKYSFNANEATPNQQSIVFNHWSAVDPGAWPNTLPACE